MSNWKEEKVPGGVRWSLHSVAHSYCNPKVEVCLGREISGFTPDSRIEEERAKQEESRDKLFAEIWEVLSQNESLSMDDENDRLILCDKIADWVEQNK